MRDLKMEKYEKERISSLTMPLILYISGSHPALASNCSITLPTSSSKLWSARAISDLHNALASGWRGAKCQFGPLRSSNTPWGSSGSSSESLSSPKGSSMPWKQKEKRNYAVNIRKRIWFLWFPPWNRIGRKIHLLRQLNVPMSAANFSTFGNNETKNSI